MACQPPRYPWILRGTTLTLAEGVTPSVVPSRSSVSRSSVQSSFSGCRSRTSHENRGPHVLVATLEGDGAGVWGAPEVGGQPAGDLATSLRESASVSLLELGEMCI